MAATGRRVPASNGWSPEVNEVYGQLPIPLMIAIMLLGIVLVLIACTPTAWVDRAYKSLRKRYGQTQPR